jgi:hypothetical protein
MQLQGYVEPIARTTSWRTTEAGLTVAGAKTARLTRKAEFSLRRSAFGLRRETRMLTRQLRQWNIKLKKYSSSSCEVEARHSTSKTMSRG